MFVTFAYHHVPEGLYERHYNFYFANVLGKSLTLVSLVGNSRGH
jgi:hypothetical protein